MLRNRVHTLSFSVTVTADPTKDESGNWIPGVTTTEQRTAACRAVPNGQGKTIKSNDGQEIVFAWMVWMNKLPEGIRDGIAVEIYNGETKIGGGYAKRPFQYQKHAVLWV